MLIIATSPDALLKQGKPYGELADVLKAARAAGNPVGVISNHDEPDWFSKLFSGTKVQFLKSKGRQSGEILSLNAAEFKLAPYDVVVLATKDEDVQMGKNGGAVLLAAGWSDAPQVKDLGIRIDSPADLGAVFELLEGWSGTWWFSAAAKTYSVHALMDLSAYGKSATQQDFSTRLTETVKKGGARLNALLTISARSLLTSDIGTGSSALWGVYPSSSSTNDDEETLSDFSHRLRTTVSRVRMAYRGEPLFIRHKPSPKRSSGAGGDRTDPTGQILTLHLNPYYAKSGRLRKRDVVVLDDCTTYGVSFGVAAAFLRKAGAASVTGVALGKFGNQLREYEIQIDSDPFQPVGAKDFTWTKPPALLAGTSSVTSQQVLLKLIP